MGEPPSIALSFDDVLLLPAHSAVLPGEVNVGTKLASIGLNVPVLSSAMDTVTESELAIALAREGGLGVVHRNMPIDLQVEQVARVKRSENTVIQSPLTVSPDARLGELHRLMAEKGVSGFPVVDKDGKLVGMVTSRDMWYIDDESTPVSAVMTPGTRLATGTPQTSFEDALKIIYTHRIEKLPLVDSSGRLAGLITKQDIIKRQTFKNAAKDGKANGSFESKPENEAQTDTGTWKVDSTGKFCYKWNNWDSGKEKCLSIYKLSNGFLVINGENGFESMILSEQIKSGNQMKAILQ